MTPGTPALSIVVPAGPGDDAWRRLLPALRRACDAAGCNAQILLVLPDDDSPASCDIPASVQLVRAPAGRASQLNAGARQAAAQCLWFVHADSVFRDDPLAALTRFIERGDEAIGYFSLRFLDDGPTLTAFNTAGAWLRSRVLGLPFGDQALVMPRIVFDRLGGFSDVAGEDHALVWAAHRAGVPVRALGASVHTSARRYATAGWLTTTARHLVLTLVQAWRFSRRTSTA